MLATSPQPWWVGPDITQQLKCTYMCVLLVLFLWRALTNPHPKFFETEEEVPFLWLPNFASCS